MWATRALDGTTRVVVINESSRARAVAVRPPATGATGAAGAAGVAGSLELLEAPSLSARQDVTLGGQGYGASTATGLLAGPARIRVVARSARGYVFGVPAGSAAMLTLPAG